MAKAKRKSFIEKRKKELILIAIALLIVVGVSFAWLTQTIRSISENVIVSGNLQLTLNNESPIIKLGGVYGYGEPMSDTAGLATTPYTFTVTNTGTETAFFVLFLDDVNSYTDVNNQTVSITSATRISDAKIKCNFKGSINGGSWSGQNNEVHTLDMMGNPRNLTSGYGLSLAPGSSATFNLRLWISSTATNDDVVGKVFAARLRIEATQDDYGVDNGAVSDFAYY